MGVRKDLGTGIVYDECPVTGYPRDEYGHLLNPWDDGEFTPWGDGTELLNLTSPYGFVYYVIGNDDTAVCLDYATVTGPKGRFIILHSMIDSESGGFCDGLDYDILPINTFEDLKEAVRAARQYVHDAYDALGGRRHDKKGCDQDPFFYVNDIFFELFPEKRVKSITPRMIRMNSKRVERIVQTTIYGEL